VEVSLSIPPGSLTYWTSRLAHYGVTTDPLEQRFDRSVIPATDPHGLRVALVETADAMTRPFTPWENSPVPPERQIRGLESARLRERELTPTTSFLTEVLGFSLIGEERGWHRYGLARGASGAYVDIQEAPQARRGAWGVGSVHHLAWRVDDGDHQLALRHDVDAAGRRPTPVIDRFWFQSVYFLEPGGVLFELATDGPGFAVDEDPAHLGESLVLPPWLEAQRGQIEAVLPALRMPEAMTRE
jgi:glyoxalase family protein